MTQEKIWDYFQGEGLESFSGSVPRLRFLFQKVFRTYGSRQPKVLNIGVGNGWLESRCVGQKWETYSLDPSDVAVGRVNRIGSVGALGHIEAMPYADKFFDVVFCSEVLEHLSNEQLSLGLKEVNRVLVKGGCLVGTVPFNEQLIDNQVVCPDCGKVFHRWGHLQSFGKAKLRASFEASNFEVIIISTYAFPDFSRRAIKDKIKSSARWFLGRMGSPIAQPNLFFIVKK